MDDAFLVNSIPSYTAYVSHVQILLDEYKYLTFPKPRIGPDRSLDQNALLHVWATEVAAYRLDKGVKQVTKGELEGTKRDLKMAYYNYSGAEFMIYEVTGTISGNIKRDYTSSADWKRGEMYQVLTWMQMYVAEFGLVLESKGQFKKLQRETVG